ncbi:hypothetical protein KDL44_10025 [bacterium]|nr:hypothetical protein [bacterium]
MRGHSLGAGSEGTALPVDPPPPEAPGEGWRKDQLPAAGEMEILGLGLLGSWLLLLLFPLSLFLDWQISLRLKTRQLKQLHFWLLPWVVIPLTTALSSLLGFFCGTAELCSTMYTPVSASLGDIHGLTHCRVRSFVICIPPPLCTLLRDIPANLVPMALAGGFGPMRGLVPGRLPTEAECVALLEHAAEQPDLATALASTGGSDWQQPEPALLRELSRHQELMVPVLNEYSVAEDSPARVVDYGAGMLIVGQPVLDQRYWGEAGEGRMLVSLINTRRRSVITKFRASSTVWDAWLATRPLPEGQFVQLNQTEQRSSGNLEQKMREQGLEPVQRARPSGVAPDAGQCRELLPSAAEFPDAAAALDWAEKEHGMHEAPLWPTDGMLYRVVKMSGMPSGTYRPCAEGNWQAAVREGWLLLAAPVECSGDSGFSYQAVEGAWLVSVMNLATARQERLYLLPADSDGD